MYDKQNLLIWDIDGTLIQGRGIGRRAMDKAFRTLYGIENGFENVDMAGRLDALILKDAFSIHGIADKDSDRFFRTYQEFLKDEIDILTVSIEAPGIIKLLQKLSESTDFYNVLGTGNIEGAARIKLSKHNMNDFFPTGGFGDKEAERWEVIREAIDKAQQHFGLFFSRENIYVIGDTPRDIECGKKLGAKSIGVATGMYSVQELEQLEPDHVFQNFTDIEKFTPIFLK